MDRRFFFLTARGILYAQTVPSDHHVVGLIGSGGRGRFVTSVFAKDARVRIGAVCDVYEPNLEAGLSANKGAKAYRNYKALLDDKDIDIVVIATPEHWHHRMVLDAMMAGKDIYVEKPLCQKPEQGVELVATAKNSRSVVQVGTQRRSYDLYIKARAIMKQGTLGNVHMVRSWWINNQLKPETGQLRGPVDWEQWQGPAPRRRLEPARFLDWRSYTDYAGGIMADQGIHVFDSIHMLMSSGYPKAVNASAGRIHRPGVDTPESVVVAAEYPDDFLAIFTINYAGMRYKPVNDQLSQYDGDKARLDIGRETFSVYFQGAEQKPAISERSEGFTKATESHVNNFLECVRTRATPNAPIEFGFQATLVTQMANISLHQGRRVRWNASLNKIEV
jgi:predicted dehydrogenase